MSDTPNTRTTYYNRHDRPSLVPRTPADALIALVAITALVGALGFLAWTLLTPPPPNAIIVPGEAPQSSSQTPQSDTAMSGDYEVGPNGKLLRPKTAPIPQAPTPPDTMQFETPEGMEAFANYVMELLPYMWMTGDTSKLEAISLPECSWCEDTITKTKQQFAYGQWIDDVEHVLTQSGVAFEIDGHPHLWHIQLVYTRTAATIYDGAQLQDLPEEQAEISIQARYINGKWMLSEAGELQ